MTEAGLALAPFVDAGSVGLLAAIVVVLLRRPRDVATISNSTERWITRLERALDQAERRELARERNDAEHRAWDTGVLLAVATGDDTADIRRRVATLGPPPRLTPDPAEWLDAEARRMAHRRAAAPIAPDTSPLERQTGAHRG
jgi:hypothetical protein